MLTCEPGVRAAPRPRDELARRQHRERAVDDAVEHDGQRSVHCLTSLRAASKSGRRAPDASRSRRTSSKKHVVPARGPTPGLSHRSPNLSVQMCPATSRARQSEAFICSLLSESCDNPGRVVLHNRRVGVVAFTSSWNRGVVLQPGDVLQSLPRGRCHAPRRHLAPRFRRRFLPSGLGATFPCTPAQEEEQEPSTQPRLRDTDIHSRETNTPRDARRRTQPTTHHQPA